MGLARQQAQSVLALSLYEDEDMINHALIYVINSPYSWARFTCMYL